MKYLRFLASIENAKHKRSVGKLTEEQKYVYNIAKKIVSLSDSVLESSPNTGIFYVKNGLKLIKFDRFSIHFINGKYSYFFSYNGYFLDELKTIFYRHKQIRINHLVEEISNETTSHLKNIYFELNEKQNETTKFL
jgi:hypothetical protein